MSGYRHSPRVRFNPELWAKWWAKRQPNEHTQKLTQGVKEFRSLIGVREELAAQCFGRKFP